MFAVVPLRVVATLIDPPPRSSELDGIVEKVGQALGEPDFVTVDPDFVLVEVALKSEVLCVGVRPVESETVLNQLVEFKRASG